MKLIVYGPDQPPLEIEGARIRITCGRDNYEIREHRGKDGAYLLVRLEEHDDALALDLAVFPNGGNSVRLKGGFRP